MSVKWGQTVGLFDSWTGGQDRRGSRATLAVRRETTESVKVRGIPTQADRWPRLQPTLATPMAYTGGWGAFLDSTLGPPPTWLRPALVPQSPEKPRRQTSDILGLELGLSLGPGTEVRGMGASSASVGSGRRAWGWQQWRL